MPKKKKKLNTLHTIFKEVTVHKHRARKSTMAKKVKEIHFLALKMRKSLIIFFVLFQRIAKTTIK